MPTESVYVFIDDKNFYKGARRAFFNDDTPRPHYYGQINPIKLGELICARPAKYKRRLAEVRVYTGLPDPTKQPATHAAHSRQYNNWRQLGAEVVRHPLRYPADFPQSRPLQKGVDVALAVDFVAFAIDGYYNVGVIASTDADLRPALAYVLRKCSSHCHIEVAAWYNPPVKTRLSLPGRDIWCHRLEQTDYDAVADLTDYSNDSLAIH